MDANDPITAQLTLGEWNTVLALLAEGPFRIVAPLITNLRQQVLSRVNNGAALPAAGANSGDGVHVSD